ERRLAGQLPVRVRERIADHGQRLHLDRPARVERQLLSRRNRALPLRRLIVSERSESKDQRPASIAFSTVAAKISWPVAPRCTLSVQYRLSRLSEPPAAWNAFSGSPRPAFRSEAAAR